MDRPSGSIFAKVFEVHLDERYREGLIPPGALRCKEQGQRVCELPRGWIVQHGREPVRGVREVSGAITSVVFVP